MAQLKNFRKVSAGIYRGGQPDRAALEELVSTGFKTVVSLQKKKKVVEEEARNCGELGLDFISIPLNYSNPPRRKDVKQFLSVLDQSQKHPIFVHCLHGKDRTGIMIALYRIVEESWTVHDAYKEMEACGFHKYRLRPFKWHLFKFAENLEQNMSMLEME